MKKYSVTVLVLVMGVAHASTLWAEIGALNSGVQVSSGIGLGLPLIGTVGVEGGLDTTWDNVSRYSLGATWRDIFLPFTDVRLAFGSGLQFNHDPEWYIQAKAGSTLIGNVYWQSIFRFEPRSQVFSAGLGIGIAF